MDEFNSNNAHRMLLHACCGPCSLEPVRILREAGHDPDIYYSNSNIAPKEEYEKRLETLREYWNNAECSIVIISGEHIPQSWESECGEPFRVGKISREERCRACYRLRFEQSAKYAAENGYDSLGTTLSVSPYQYTDIIREELERACEEYGLTCMFEDYRPYYSEATRRSKDAGMYRQNYCGCTISIAEAKAERAERREQRKKEKAARDEALAEKRAMEEAKLQKQRAARRAYDEKKARQNEILREIRMAAKATSEEAASSEAISEN